ncbi:hypothetical protein ApAK_01950 [Thermoplasmatales archaeon AK]|nr:hypothetical protein [Thermoplasmatales archaeon AK]
MNSRKAGRPTIGGSKLVQRAITSDPEIEEFLRKNPSINASEVFRRAIRSMMPRDSDSIRLSKLAEEISRMRSSLSMKEAEYESLKKRVEERERVQLDLRLEQDCHAWYLRSLVQLGIFRIMRRDPMDPLKIIEDEIRAGVMKASEISYENGRIRLTDRASPRTRRLLRNFMKGDILVTIPGSEWVTPSQDSLRSQYGLSIDFPLFEREFMANPSMGDLPLEFFRQFKPLIVENRIKAEVKARMEPSYRSIPVEVGGSN